MSWVHHDILIQSLHRMAISEEMLHFPAPKLSYDGNLLRHVSLPACWLCNWWGHCYDGLIQRGSHTPTCENRPHPDRYYLFQQQVTTRRPWCCETLWNTPFSDVHWFSIIIFLSKPWVCGFWYGEARSQDRKSVWLAVLILHVCYSSLAELSSLGQTLWSLDPDGNPDVP